MTRIGVLGGSFDPLHAGHMALARAAWRSLHLDKVLLLPCHTPPHAQGKRCHASPWDRFAMCALAAAPYPWLDVSPLELEAGRRRYTIDTLRALRRENPGARLVFLMGEDSLHDMPSWKNSRMLAREFDFAVLRRRQAAPPAPLPDFLAERLRPARRFPQAAPGIYMLRARKVKVSSTALRRSPRRAAVGAMLPWAVGNYIRKRGLYVAQG